MNDTTRDTRMIPATTGTPKDQIDFEKVNQGLIQANRECLDRTVPLIEMLMRAKVQFGYYVTQHKEKGTESGDAKAGINQQFVDEIEETLRVFRESGTKDPDPVEQAMAADEAENDQGGELLVDTSSRIMGRWRRNETPWSMED